MKRPLLLTLAVSIGLILTTLWIFGQRPLAVQAKSLDAYSTYYVATDGLCGGDIPCYTTIQAAIDAADADDDLVKVAAGTYAGVNARAGVTQTVYISKSLTIQGGYTTTNWITPDSAANPTTLDAVSQGRVLYITGDITLTIAGLRITGGNATGLGGQGGSDAGGGVIVLTSTVIFSDCTIYGNTIPLVGGGIYAYTATITINNSAIHNNTSSYAGGGIYLDESNGACLSGNDIHTNMASAFLGFGGGIVLDESDGATLSSNNIYSNVVGGFSGLGGGIYLLSSDDAILNSNAVNNNIAAGSICYGGGINLTGGSARLANNVIAGNESCSLGGGVYASASTVDMTHCTLAGNTGIDGSGVHVTDESGFYGSVALTNTILVSHTVGITVTSGSTATLQATLWYSNGVDAGGTGTMISSNNVTGDPAFVDPATWDYRIGTGSMALDAGVFAGIAVDFEGDARPTNPARPDAPDLGYDENKALTVRRPVAGTVTFGAACARVVFTNTGGLEAITLTVEPGRFPTTYPADQVVSRTVLLTPSSSASFSATLTLCYEDSEVKSGLDESELALYRWTGSVWQEYASGVDMVNNVATASNVAASSPWLIGDMNQTPNAVHLRAVSARPAARVAALGVLAAFATATMYAWLWRKHKVDCQSAQWW
jgi:hypothetical protein